MPRMTIELSSEIDDRLNAIAIRNGITKAEAMRRAFALLAVADDQKQKGNGSSVGIVRENDKRELIAVGRIAGI